MACASAEIPNGLEFRTALTKGANYTSFPSRRGWGTSTSSSGSSTSSSGVNNRRAITWPLPRFPNRQALADLPFTNAALYALSGRGVPEEILDEAIQRAEAGATHT
jgi:hypothetical protein